MRKGRHNDSLIAIQWQMWLIRLERPSEYMRHDTDARGQILHVKTALVTRNNCISQRCWPLCSPIFFSFGIPDASVQETVEPDELCASAYLPSSSLVPLYFYAHATGRRAKAIILVVACG